jgi:two-component system NtrC family sensor kinase
MNPNKNRRILIIDDNRSIHADFHKILSPGEATQAALEVAESALFGSKANRDRQIPFEVDSAYQGQEGVAMVKKALEEGRPYAMAFVDIRMWHKQNATRFQQLQQLAKALPQTATLTK